MLAISFLDYLWLNFHSIWFIHFYSFFRVSPLSHHPNIFSESKAIFNTCLEKYNSKSKSATNLFTWQPSAKTALLPKYWCIGVMHTILPFPLDWMIEKYPLLATDIDCKLLMLHKLAWNHWDISKCRWRQLRSWALDSNSVTFGSWQ